MPSESQPLSGQFTPGTSKIEYPTPIPSDKLLNDILANNAADYLAVVAGTAHPNFDKFPDHRLVAQVPINWEIAARIYANDRTPAEDSYNASVNFSGEAKEYPIFIRDYLVRRSAEPASRRNRLSTLTGVINTVVVTGGQNYTDAAIVTATGGAGTGFAATAIVSNGVVIGIAITNEGNGYTSAPSLAITDTGGGSGATATAAIQPTTAVLVKEDVIRNQESPTDSLYVVVRRIYETLPGPWIYKRRLIVTGASDAAFTYFETKRRRVRADTYPSFATDGISDVVDNETSVVGWEQIEGFVNGTGASVAAKIYIDRIVDEQTDVILTSYHQIVAGDTADSALRTLYDSDSPFGTSTITAFNTVASIAVLIAGSSETKPTLAIDAPLVPGGTQATATVATMGAITASIAALGSGYTDGDLLTVSGVTSGTTARFTATVVDGDITELVLDRAGSYSVLPSNPASVTGGTGTGATLTVFWSILTVTVTNTGTGYRVTPNVFPSVGGANLRATLGGSGTYTVDCYVYEAELEDIEGSAKKLLKWQTAPIPAPLVTHIDDGFTVPGLVYDLVPVDTPGTRPWPGVNFKYTPPLQIGHAARQTLVFKFGSNFDDLAEPFGITAPAAISSFFPISPNTSHPAILWEAWDADSNVTYAESFAGSTSYGQSSPYCTSSTQKRWRGRFRVKRTVEIDPAGILY